MDELQRINEGEGINAFSRPPYPEELRVKINEIVRWINSQSKQ